MSGNLFLMKMATATYGIERSDSVITGRSIASMSCVDFKTMRNMIDRKNDEGSLKAYDLEYIHAMNMYQA